MDFTSILLAKKLAVEEISKQILDSQHIIFQEVEEIPTVEEAKSNVIYLVFNDVTQHYDMYALISNEIRLLDDTSVDLTDYAKKNELPTKLSDLENDQGYLTEVPNSDWSINNEDEPGYIKNRPFYDNSESFSLVKNETLVDDRITSDSIIGSKVTIQSPHYKVIATPTQKPTTENIIIYDPENSKLSFGFIYTNPNGILTSKVLYFIYTSNNSLKLVCPTFFKNYPNYDTFVYVYEPTSDTLGLGITLEKGWYAVNGTTFAFTDFDIEQNPIILPISEEPNDIQIDETNISYIASFESIIQSEITSDHIYNELVYAIPHPSFDDVSHDLLFNLLYGIIVFRDTDLLCNRDCSLDFIVYKKIDAKYLPDININNTVILDLDKYGLKIQQDSQNCPDEVIDLITNAINDNKKIGIKQITSGLTSIIYFSSYSSLPSESIIWLQSIGADFDGGADYYSCALNISSKKIQIHRSSATYANKIIFDDGESFQYKYDSGELRGPEGPMGPEGFPGSKGYSPQRGIDYWTEEDIQVMRDYIDQQLGVIENGTY